MAPLLELKNLEYYYGGIHALCGLNVYVDKGEMVTLIGSNGAGKTTTLQTISGLTNPRGIRGEIWFDGKNITGLRGHEISKLGISQVLEGRHIFSKLTVMENLKMGAYNVKDKALTERTINELIFPLFPRLKERQEQLGGTLSGGEQQMLAIGRALVSQPKLLMLDEPSLGLAPNVIHEIFEAIKKIREQGFTILFVEQNSKVALNVADRGYVIQTGEITLTDTCDRLLVNEDVKKAYLGG